MKRQRQLIRRHLPTACCSQGKFPGGFQVSIGSDIFSSDQCTGVTACTCLPSRCGDATATASRTAQTVLVGSATNPNSEPGALQPTHRIDLRIGRTDLRSRFRSCCSSSGISRKSPLKGSAGSSAPSFRKGIDADMVKAAACAHTIKTATPRRDRLQTLLGLNLIRTVRTFGEHAISKE
jgi:hypothetical protein